MIGWCICLMWIILFMLNIILNLIEKAKRWRFRKLRKNLLNRIIQDLNGEELGSFILPKYKALPDCDAETGKDAYRYVQILDDGRWRTIYITSDGKDICKLPWRSDQW